MIVQTHFIYKKVETWMSTSLQILFSQSSNYFEIKFLPVISDGCSRPITDKIDGATSANTPLETFTDLASFAT